MNPGILDMLANCRRPLVLAHESPDGDALGSVLGLVHMLKGMGKEAVGYREGQLPDEYRFLPGVQDLITGLPPKAGVDLVVLLDCHEPKRTGSDGKSYLSTAKLPAVVIDHHRGEAKYGDEVWVDPTYAATCEMLAELAAKGGIELSPRAATCLYAGILTDTGSFAHANTSARVLKNAARLVEAGAAPEKIHSEVFATRPVRQFLFCRILEKAQRLMDGRVILATVSLADLAELNARPYDLENVVEGLRNIPGVLAAALIKERSGGGVKLSMRSKGGVDVAGPAMELGGGGHKNAAGCSLDMGIGQAAELTAGLLNRAVEA